MDPDDKRERNIFLREKCSTCTKEGTYLCKMLFNKNNECMFYEEYDEDIDCFREY